MILDTSVLIAAERGSFDMPAFLRAQGEAPVAIAAITAAELLHGCERAHDALVRERRARYVEGLLAVTPVLPFGLAEARVHARLWASLAAGGRLIGPHDLLVAATALLHQAGLATFNRAEFERVPELVLIPLGPS